MNDRIIRVSDHQKNIARARGINNVNQLVEACKTADVPFYVACTLMEKESHGKNVYGNDEGGMLSGFSKPVNRSNFEAFWHEVSRGRTSNGVGPSQITSRWLIEEMFDNGLRPWIVLDNMKFGLTYIRSLHRQANGSWWEAARRYNGSTEYADDFVSKMKKWKEWLS